MTIASHRARVLRRERKKARRGEFIGNIERELIALGGVNLNWVGDYLGNPDLRWEYRRVPIDDILFTGTSPEWNDLLINECERKPTKLRELITANPILGQQLNEDASKWLTYFGSCKITLRLGDARGNWKVLDGMVEFVQAVIQSQDGIMAFVPTNERDVRPHCEEHSVYDLLKAFERVETDQDDLLAFGRTLGILAKANANVRSLLENRFLSATRNMPANKTDQAINLALSRY